MGAIAAAVVGAIGMGVGTAMSANAASKRKKFIQYIADTPGVNIGDTYNDTLGAMEKATPQAERIASGQNTFNQAELDRLVEQSIPGYADLQAQRIKNAGSDLRGIIPEDVSQEVYRKSAAQALEGGYSGSASHGNLTARDLGLTSLGLQSRGAQEFQNILGTTPMAPRVMSGSFLNIDPKTGLAVRSNERSQKMDILLQKAKTKGATDIWGEFATQLGSSLFSSGMGGMNLGMPNSGGNSQAIQAYRASDAYAAGGPTWGG